MPHKDTIDSIPKALTFMGKTSGTYLNTPLAVNRPYTDAEWAPLNPDVPTSLHSRCLQAYQTVQNNVATQTGLVREAKRLALRAAMYISHFYQELDDTILREELPSGPGARAYYGRPVEGGAIPAPHAYDAIKAEADKIVSGEARRLAAEGVGAVALAMPTATQVGAARDELKDALDAVQSAVTATDNAREALNALEPAVFALCAKSVARIELLFMDDPNPSSFRAKCIRWGVVYIYDEGETPDVPPEPTPPTPPPPAP